MYNKRMEKKPLNKYLLIVTGLMLLFIGYFVVTFYLNNSTESNFTANYQDIPTPSPDDHYKWRANSDLTLINYYSMDCPFCLELSVREDELQSLYGHSFNLIYRYSPLPDIQPLSFEKSVITECVFAQAGEDQMFKFISDIFTGYQPVQTDNDWVKDIAYNYISDKGSFNVCLDGQGLATVTSQVKDALAHGVYSTPTFVMFKGDELVVKLERASLRTIERAMESMLDLE